MSLTRDDIEARNYSYCVATYGVGQGADALCWRRFLVPSPFKVEARKEAMAYATERWGPPDNLDVYSRNYVHESRMLFSQKAYPGAYGEASS